MRGIGLLLGLSVAVHGGCTEPTPSSHDPTTTGSTDDTGAGGTGTSPVGSSSAVDTGETSTSTAGDDGTGEPTPTVPTIGPTSGPLTLDFRLALTGNGTLDVGAIDIVDGYGTVEVDGRPRPVIVHERQPWPDQGYTLYQSIAVTEDAWTILWFYCTDGELTNIYLESTDGIALHYEIGQGSCDGMTGSVTVDVDLPGTALDVVANGDAFSIQGPQVTIENGMLGSVTVGDTDFVVAPFQTVDCTGCGMGGWFEIHMMLWDPIGGRMCFAIAYLSTSGQVQLTYAISLPDLSDPLGGDVWLDAEWTYG